MNRRSPGSVLCFGECLWDSLPRGLFPGGAPLNVAYHLSRWDAWPVLVSAVGQDVLGEELVRRIQAWNLDATGVGVVPGKCTGLSRVTLRDGGPRFEVLADVAWDRIVLEPGIRTLARSARALVFGTLALRQEHNRAVLAELLALAPPGAWRVLDANLRPPFDSAELAWELAAHSDLVKVNREELSTLISPANELSETDSDIESAVRRFAGRAGTPRVCCTAGAAGAGLLIEGEWLWASARPVDVRDAVGAGDSFLATLLWGLLEGVEAPSLSLERACRVAEFVAGQDGATPVYDSARFAPSDVR